MSSHYISSHFGGSHYLSSHFGRLEITVEEIGGGSHGGVVRGSRPGQKGHGHVVTVQLPGARPGVTAYDDADLALLAVALIEEFYE